MAVSIHEYVTRMLVGGAFGKEVFQAVSREAIGIHLRGSRRGNKNRNNGNSNNDIHCHHNHRHQPSEADQSGAEWNGVLFLRGQRLYRCTSNVNRKQQANEKSIENRQYMPLSVPVPCVPSSPVHPPPSISSRTPGQGSDSLVAVDAPHPTALLPERGQPKNKF